MARRATTHAQIAESGRPRLYIPLICTQPDGIARTLAIGDHGEVVDLIARYADTGNPKRLVPPKGS